MSVSWQKSRLVVRPGPGDAPDAATWAAAHAGIVFRLRLSIGGELMFVALGPEAEACRTPINITSKAPAPLNLISNFAKSPFDLDGRRYASVEGFWQGLKFPDETDRRRLAALWGSRAKDAGHPAPRSDRIEYDGETILIGTWAHWQLMERASLAKFAQNDAARQALLSTGLRPLTHQIKPDSRTIPGAILAEIWTRIRDRWHGAV